MKRNAQRIKTLQDAVVYFSDPDNSLDYMANKLWPNGVACPACGRKDVVFLKTQRKWQCKSVHPKRQFSAKVGTIFEDSPIPLEKWLPVMWMLSNCRNGVSSCEIARTIGVTQKSAWFMLHRIRLAMQNGSLMKLGGSGSPVQVDETFIGGKARNMHKIKRAKLDNMGFDNKVIVAGMLEGDGKVKTQVIENRSMRTLQTLVKAHVESGATLHTDDFYGYWGLYREYLHEIVNHAETYVSGKVHTNGIENFWSLVKRGLHGTYVSVEPFHLFRYLDEQSFRFNNRKDGKVKLTDRERFDIALSGVAGKRITYQQLIGRGLETQAN
ncbi:MAG: IS1595 family transposase [Acidobacteriia bacterium]|nr:IS1595 family transposase [Terriglobia bacterium]